MSKPITIMEARRIHKLFEAGVTQAQIALEVGVSRRAVYNILKGRGMEQQRKRADRAEALFGGVLGPGNGNYRRECRSWDDEQLETERWSLGPSELTGDDPLDVLLAEEAIQERLDHE